MLTEVKCLLSFIYGIQTIRAADVSLFANTLRNSSQQVTGPLHEFAQSAAKEMGIRKEIQMALLRNSQQAA